MLSLGAALGSVVRHNGPRPAMLDARGTYSWADFGGRVARLGAALNSLGIARARKFGILSRNGFRYEELLWAGFATGTIPVPLNFRFAPPEIAQILADAECELVFVEAPFAATLAHEALAPWQARALVFGEASGASAEKYEALLPSTIPAPAVEIDPDEDAILLYTGGTTGRSKGVRLSHTNILSDAVAFGMGVGARCDDVFMHTAPMFHSADLLATAWMLQGAAHCHLPQYTPAAFAETVARWRASATVTVPTMLIALVSDPGFDPAAFASLRLLMYGAAPMAVEWIERVARAFPNLEFLNCYGLTETAPDLTIFDAREFRAAIEHAIATGDRSGPLTSVGKPNGVVELRIVDGAGREVSTGEAGELIARGPNIMKGYLNRPDETAAALRNGWLHTGDIARIDEHGYVYLLDRLKDMVITGGENVYCAEVEAVLHRHPAVAEAAIIGAPDARLGETVMAVIVMKVGAKPDAEEIVKHCRNDLGGFKIPRRIVFAERLPKSALGKVLKAELRKSYSSS